MEGCVLFLAVLFTLEFSIFICHLLAPELNAFLSSLNTARAAGLSQPWVRNSLADLTADILSTPVALIEASLPVGRALNFRAAGAGISV